MVFVPYWRCKSRTIFYSAVVNRTVVSELFYPGGGIVDTLPCTTLDSATKRLKESDLIVTQPSNNFSRYSILK